MLKTYHQHASYYWAATIARQYLSQACPSIRRQPPALCNTYPSPPRPHYLAHLYRTAGYNLVTYFGYAAQSASFPGFLHISAARCLCPTGYCQRMWGHCCILLMACEKRRFSRVVRIINWYMVLTSSRAPASESERLLTTQLGETFSCFISN